VYGLENAVDFLSSVVVLWRFFAPASVSPELERKLHRREKRASMAISFILVMLGIGIIGAAAADIARGQEDPDDLKKVIAISFISLLVFGVLAALKFRYARALDSASLYKDGICSLIGTILAGALFINTLIIEKVPEAWWIDPLVALACGVASMIIGFHALYVAKVRDGLPIFTCQWWFTSQGDGMDERSGRALGPDDFGKQQVELRSRKTASEDEDDIV